MKFYQGDIFDSEAGVLVNPVNCVGVMGAGLALKFKEAYPGNYEFYKRMCSAGMLNPGTLCVYKENGKTIINFPTKQHWKYKSTIAILESGLSELIKHIKQKDVKSIAVPALGCGHGGLNWFDVEQTIRRAFKQIPKVNAELYSPGGIIHWVIYKHPRDYPDKYVARQFINDKPNRIPLTADTLKRIRAAIPPGMIHLSRETNDDPVIVETWI